MHSNCANLTILLVVLVLTIAFNLKLISPCLFFPIPLANLMFPTSCHFFSFLHMQLAVPVSDLSPKTLLAKPLRMTALAQLLFGWKTASKI